MSFISVIRDGENLGEAMVQREQAFILSDCPVVGGVGTGFSAGVVGKMNGAAGANPNHFSVQANGANLILTIQPGYCWIVKDSGSLSYDPKVVYVVMNASTTITVPSNSQGTSRTDTICLRFDQSIAPDANGTNLPTIVDVQGGASNALGNAPADGALYLPLANVVIANAATTLSQSNVTDRRFVQPSQAQFRAYWSGGTIATNAIVPFDNIQWDKAGKFVTGASAGYTIPLPGKYQVNGRLRANAAWTGMFQVNINGGALDSGLLASAASLLSSQINDVLGFAYGDLLQGVAANSGLTAIGGVGDNYFTMNWVGF